MRSIVKIPAIVLFYGVLAACTAYIPESAPTVAPEETLQSSPSPTPTPIPVSAFIPDAEVFFQTDFDSEEELPETWSATHTVFEDGVAVVDANEDWQGLYTGYRWASGETLLWRFRYAAGSQANISVSAGEWETASFRQWGILNDHGQMTPQFWEGERYLLLGWHEGFVQLEPDHWYVLMIHIGSPDEPFVIRIWDEEVPGAVMETRQTFGDPGWDNLQWNASATNGPTGALEIDHFEAIQDLPEFSAEGEP
jgi:hypothetical protein